MIKALVTLTLLLVLTGCQHQSIKVMEYPLPDAELLVTPPKLILLPDDAELSDVSKTITKNYTTYKVIATRLELLQTWVIRIREESLHVNDRTTDSK